MHFLELYNYYDMPGITIILSASYNYCIDTIMTGDVCLIQYCTKKVCNWCSQHFRINLPLKNYYGGVIWLQNQDHLYKTWLVYIYCMHHSIWLFPQPS